MKDDRKIVVWVGVAIVIVVLIIGTIVGVVVEKKHPYEGELDRESFGKVFEFSEDIRNYEGCVLFSITPKREEYALNEKSSDEIIVNVVCKFYIREKEVEGRNVWVTLRKENGYKLSGRFTFDKSFSYEKARVYVQSAQGYVYLK